MFRKLGVFATVLFFSLVTTANAQQGQRFGSVHKITGTVVATDAATGKKRTLQRGDVVNVGELVQSGPNGEAVVRTDDAGVLAVRPNAIFKMEQFRAQGDPDDKFSIRILAGALRMITGWTGALNKSNYVVATPTSTIGIRGTDHEPYVLTKELAAKFKQPEGTYNKVTRGGTTLEAAGGQVDIEPGQVGFAPYGGKDTHRGLLTVLMPSLLEKVPGFFVPGQFDDELESIAAEDLAQALAKLSGQPAPVPESKTTAAPVAAAQAAKPQASNIPAASGVQCDAVAIATDWLTRLDGAIYSRDAALYVGMFAPQSRITARVKTGGGNMAEVKYNRDELAKSTFTALKDLTQFDTRRPSISAVLVSGATAAKCNALDVESLVIESGTRKGATYRLESLETYRLVLRGNRWLALEASTTQK
jgi:hypothetical protein